MTKQRFWVLVTAAWMVSVAGIITMIARYAVNPPWWAQTIVFVLAWPALPDRKTNR